MAVRTKDIERLRKTAMKLILLLTLCAPLGITQGRAIFNAEAVANLPAQEIGPRDLVDPLEAFAPALLEQRDDGNLIQWVDGGTDGLQVDALIGNSSSGIMEAASFALPTVNVGLRQQGRERARNVIDAPAKTTAILGALRHALDPEFRLSLRGLENPYGDGTAAETIARVLSTVPLEGLLIKQPTPLPAESRNADEL